MMIHADGHKNLLVAHEIYLRHKNLCSRNQRFELITLSLGFHGYSNPAEQLMGTTTFHSPSYSLFTIIFPLGASRAWPVQLESFMKPAFCITCTDVSFAPSSSVLFYYTFVSFSEKSKEGRKDKATKEENYTT
jgi:hypothetical protein